MPIIVVKAYMSTLRHSYGVSVILASLKTSVPETKISVIWRSPRDLKKCDIFGNQKWKRSLVLRAPVPGPDLLFTPWWREQESRTFLRPMFHQRRWRFRKRRQYHQKLQGWPLCPHRTCRLFRNDWWRYCRGSRASLRNPSADIRMAHSFLNYITCCYPFIQLEPIYWKLSQFNLIQRLSSTVISSRSLQCFPFMVVTMSLSVSSLTTMQNVCVCKSISS